MRTKKGTRSESFWPSIVMRKWLNIKPKVHEFSEDEVETESEDDDEHITRSRLVFETIASQKEEHQTEPGTDTRMPSARIQRRKSETLRMNYITNKDVRVMIGTWNVAGRIPFEDLELDEWLDTKESADMYVLGFQEVVPLNAGNVLGAEDSRPIPKWEAIIRRTLNKMSQPKVILKSYSAPSPLPIDTVSDDEPKEEKGMPGLADTSDGSSKLPSAENDTFRIRKRSELTNLLEELEWNKTDASDDCKKLDWPEYSLDTPQFMASGKVLRRNLSDSARFSIDHGSQNSAVDPGLKRVYQSSGNLGMLWSEQEEACDVLNSLTDISDRSSEDENLLSESTTEACGTDTNVERKKPRARYVRIVSKQMVGIYISVWVSRRLRRHINKLKVSPVGVGLMGYMGNKGSVSVSMTLFQTRLCFVCSHLTSGHKVGDQQKRNSDVYDILQRTRFSSAIDARHPQTIPSHDRIFWFGDLNYRLNLPDYEIRALVGARRWDELLDSDELSKELKSGHTFDGWKEGPIDFAPTYKYERNSNRYVGESSRDGEKKRSPAWCDRILWLGKGIRQLCYYGSELDLSDHRPVGSKFSVEVEVFDQRKLERVLNFTSAGLFAKSYKL